MGWKDDKIKMPDYQWPDELSEAGKDTGLLAEVWFVCYDISPLLNFGVKGESELAGIPLYYYILAQLIIKPDLCD